MSTAVSFDIRHYEPEKDRAAIHALLDEFFLEYAPHIREECDFLSSQEKLSVINKVIWAHERRVDGREVVCRHDPVGQIAAAWMTEDFLAELALFGDQEMFFHLHQVLNSVMTREQLWKGNIDRGLDLWVAFFARSRRTDDDLAPLVRQQVLLALQHELAGWNVRSIWLQAYGPYVDVAKSLGFQQIYWNDKRKRAVLNITRKDVIDDPADSAEQKAAKARFKGTLHDMVFTYKKPVYAQLSELDKQIVLLAMRGWNQKDIREHIKERGNLSKAPNISHHMNHIRETIKKVHPDAFSMKDGDTRWDDVVTFLKHNPWELRPTKPRDKK